MLAIKVEQRPTPRNVASRFISENEAKEYSTWICLWNQYISCDISNDEQRKKCGPVMKIEVSAGDLKGHEIAGSDPVASIIDMGVKSISFFVHQPVLLGEGPPLRPISDVLVRQSVRSFPEWEDAGHSAYTVLYSALRDKLAAGGAKGFKDLEFGRRFLRDIVKLLYSLSTF